MLRINIRMKSTVKMMNDTIQFIHNNSDVNSSTLAKIGTQFSLKNSLLALWLFVMRKILFFHISKG